MQRRLRIDEYHRYAKSGIPEYWIVNLVDPRVEVYSDPDADTGSYRARRDVELGGHLEWSESPRLRISLGELLKS